MYKNSPVPERLQFTSLSVIGYMIAFYVLIRHVAVYILKYAFHL